MFLLVYLWNRFLEVQMLGQRLRDIGKLSPIGLCQQYMTVSLFPKSHQQIMLSDFYVYPNQIGKK